MGSDLQEVLILALEIGDLDIEDETEQQSANGLREIQRMSKQINEKGRDTARSFREAADILDELWKAANKGRAVGTSVSIVGGLLTTGGGVATVMTVGAASPLLLLGMVAGCTGAGVNLVARYMEASLNSVQIKKAEKHWMETVDYVKKMKITVQSWLNSESTRLWCRDLAERHSGLDLRSFAGRRFPSLVTGCTYLQQSAAGAEAVAKAGTQATKAGAEAVAKAGTQATKAGAEAVAKVSTQATKAGAEAVAKAGTQATKAGAEAVAKVSTQATKAGAEAVAKAGTQATKAGAEAVAKAGTQATKAGAEAVAKAGTQVAEDVAQATANVAAQVGDDVAQAVTKAGAQAADDVAQASAKAGAKAGNVAGGVIIGVSAFFLAWDLYDLHCTITDLVENKGSDAAKFLRAKADELEQICSHL